jgi:WD40 repeat protein
LVSASYDGTIRIWDTESGETLVGPLEPHDGWITSVAASPDGASIASASDDRTIRVFAAATMEEIREPLVGHEKGVNCVIFSPCSKYIISASHDLTIRVWDVESGEAVRVVETAHEKNVLCLAISPDGRYIASGSVDSTIKLWDFKTGTLALGPLEGHVGTIFSVAFNNDGSRLVSSSEDETIRVWDVSSIDIRGCFVGARPAEFADDSGYRSGWIVQSARSSSPSRMLPSSDSDDLGSLLLWVPPWCRAGVWWPRNTAVISEASVKLDLSWFVHGEQWHECYQAHEDEEEG